MSQSAENLYVHQNDPVAYVLIYNVHHILHVIKTLKTYISL